MLWSVTEKNSLKLKSYTLYSSAEAQKIIKVNLWNHKNIKSLNYTGSLCPIQYEGSTTTIIKRDSFPLGFNKRESMRKMNL